MSESTHLMVDEHGSRFHDDNGVEMSAFDKAAELGRGAEGAVDGLFGEDSTMGGAAGGTVDGLSSIPLALAGGVGGIYDWITDQA